MHVANQDGNIHMNLNTLKSVNVCAERSQVKSMVKVDCNQAAPALPE